MIFSTKEMKKMQYIDGKLIKELREKENLTQADLANRIHVSDSNFAHRF